MGRTPGPPSESSSGEGGAAGEPSASHGLACSSAWLGLGLGFGLGLACNSAWLGLGFGLGLELGLKLELGLGLG